jgi:hypothetical protein
MALDFRGDQIRTHQIIATGSNGTNAQLLFYDQSVAGDLYGGLAPSFITSAIGTDIFVYFSGSRNSKNTSNSHGVVVFAGDVVVSGNLYYSSSTGTTGSYVQTDGFSPMTADWNFGNFSLKNVLTGVFGKNDRTTSASSGFIRSADKSGSTDLAGTTLTLAGGRGTGAGGGSYVEIITAVPGTVLTAATQSYYTGAHFDYQSVSLYASNTKYFEIASNGTVRLAGATQILGNPGVIIPAGRYYHAENGGTGAVITLIGTDGTANNGIVIGSVAANTTLDFNIGNGEIRFNNFSGTGRTLTLTGSSTPELILGDLDQSTGKKRNAILRATDTLGFQVDTSGSNLTIRNGKGAGAGTPGYVSIQSTAKSSFGTNHTTVEVARFTGTGSLFYLGLSGSLTNLTDGSSYLIAGTNITITTQSNGSIKIDAASGGGGTSNWDSSASYVVVGNTASLSNERALTNGTFTTLTDNGANSSIIVEVNTGSLFNALSNSYVRRDGTTTLTAPWYVGNQPINNVSKLSIPYSTGKLICSYSSGGTQIDLTIFSMNGTNQFVYGDIDSAHNGGTVIQGPNVRIGDGNDYWFHGSPAATSFVYLGIPQTGSMFKITGLNEYIFGAGHGTGFPGPQIVKIHGADAISSIFGDKTGSVIQISPGKSYGAVPSSYISLYGSTPTVASHNLVESIRVTGTGSIFYTGITGSLTTLQDGTSYLVAGTNISIVSQSNGSVLISSTGGSGGSGDPNVSFVILSTTSSVPNGRVLTSGSGITIVDNGAGNSVRISNTDGFSVYNVTGSTSNSTGTIIATIPIASNSVNDVNLSMLARNSTQTDRARFSRNLIVYRSASNNATIQDNIINVPILDFKTAASWDMNFTTSGSFLVVSVTGSVSQSVNWASVTKIMSI